MKINPLIHALIQNKSGALGVYMKNQVVFLAISFVSVLAFAREPYFARQCRLSQGQYWVVAVPGDKIGLCRLGEAVILSDSLALHQEGQNQKAVEVYLSNMNKGNCSAYSAQTLVGVDTENQEFTLCRFNDGSAIGLETLKAGSSAIENSILNNALKLFE